MIYIYLTRQIFIFNIIFSPVSAFIQVLNINYTDLNIIWIIFKNYVSDCKLTDAFIYAIVILNDSFDGIVLTHDAIG